MCTFRHAAKLHRTMVRELEWSASTQPQVVVLMPRGSHWGGLELYQDA